MSLWIDCSNWTGPLTAEALAAWRDTHGVERVIVQAIDPPPGYPAGVTRQQIEACAAAGIPTDAYVWVWSNADQAVDIPRKLALLEGLPISRLWVDAEDTEPATVDRRIMAVDEALALCDAWSTDRGLPAVGVYTAAWWFRDYLGDRERPVWSHRPLWFADYGSGPGAFAPFGGWTDWALHQYQGTSTLAGVRNVDLNVPNSAVPAVAPPEPAEVDESTRLANLVNVLGYVAGDLANELEAEAQRRYGPRRAPVQSIVDRIRAAARPHVEVGG